MSGRFGLEIRAATPADAAGLAELFAVSGEGIEAHALAARVDAIRGSCGTVLVAMEWGPPSGVVAVHWHPSLAANQNIASISLLLVAPNSRRRGIGRLLVKAASQAARLAGCDVITILVTKVQPELQSFCEETGFARAARLYERGLRRKGKERLLD